MTKFLDKISEFLTNNIVLTFSSILILGVLSTLLPLRDYSIQAFKIISLEDASLYSQAITEFRSIYTSEVVERVKKAGFNITHLYKDDEKSIPLPATLSMLLGERIAQKKHGGKVSLYSAYPFPWRKEKGGLRDQFAKDAWSFFQDNPHKSYYQFNTINGVKYLRYATADLMRKSCVNCHNTHPETPRKGWKEGDVRGVLEITRSVNSVTDKINNVYNLTVIKSLSFIGFFSLFILFILYVLKRKITILHQQQNTIQFQQEQLINTSKLSALGEMAGNIAHEINNPMTIINSCSDSLKILCKKNKLTQNNMSEILHDIDITVDRVTKIINSLKAVSRNSNKDESKPVTIKYFVEDVLNLLGEKFKINEIEILADLNLPIFNEMMVCKRIQLSQVFLNLLNNAFDAVIEEKYKWIALAVEKDNEYYHFKVTNCGKKIDPEFVDKIFDPFFTTKEIGKGTGLGLSLSNSIIKEHGGQIYLDKNSKNTCFIIKIPCKARLNIS